MKIRVTPHLRELAIPPQPVDDPTRRDVEESILEMRLALALSNAVEESNFRRSNSLGNVLRRNANA